MMTDPIADMLTRIRNANALKYESVKMPSSKMKVEIAKILKEEGFIEDYKVSGKVKKELAITLKYYNGERVISGLKKISKPGLRVNVGFEKLPKVLKGLGIAIISTSQGVIRLSLTTLQTCRSQSTEPVSHSSRQPSLTTPATSPYCLLSMRSSLTSRSPRSTPSTAWFRM